MLSAQVSLENGAVAGKLNWVKAAVARGADPKADQSNALLQAVAADAVDVVAWLLPRSDLHADTMIGQTALCQNEPHVLALLGPLLNRQRVVHDLLTNMDMQDHLIQAEIEAIAARILPFTTVAERAQWLSHEEFCKLPGLPAMHRADVRQHALNHHQSSAYRSRPRS